MVKKSPAYKKGHNVKISKKEKNVNVELCFLIRHNFKGIYIYTSKEGHNVKGKLYLKDKAYLYRRTVIRRVRKVT